MAMVAEVYIKMIEDFISRFRQSLQQCLEDSQYCERTYKFAVAISGGADSTFLALMMQTLHEQDSINVQYVTVDHMLRDDSTKEAQTAVHNLRSIGIKNCNILTWQHKDNIVSNIMHQAREARYSLLTEWCKMQDITHLCVAHNQNDQAETILQRLIHGSSISGMCGIPKSTIINNINVVRPLLSWQRQEIEQILQAKGIAWISDPSNNNTRFDRVKIRQTLDLIAETGITLDKSMLIKRICRTGQHMMRGEALLSEQTNIAQKQCQTKHANGSVMLDLPKLLALPHEILFRILKNSLLYTSGHHRIRMKSINSVFTQLKRANFQQMQSCGCIIQKITNASGEFVLIQRNN